MKRNYLFLILFTVQFLILSCREWTVPEVLIGNWAGQQKATVRYNKDKTRGYQFIKAPDSVQMVLTFAGNGRVSGSFGSARFEGCQVMKNRGWVASKLNIGDDYIITGKLTGPIFPADTLMIKEISLPFDLDNGKLSGGIFQKQGMGVFPMAGVHLVKQ
jgi:hypothetical protein